MDLKKFRKSVTALTLGTLLVTNLGLPVFVKASDDGQKLSEIKEKVGKNCTIDSTKDTNEILKTYLKKFKKPVKTLTLGKSIITCIGLAKLFLDKVVNVKENVENPKVTVSGTNNTCSGKITKVAKIEEVIEDNDNSEEETPIGSRSIPSERGKLDRYHQGVVSGYLDAATLAKMKQVNKKTADGTKCYGYINPYIEKFYNKFTQRIGYMRDYTGHEGNYLYVKKSLKADGFLCENLDEVNQLLKLLEKQVNIVFVKEDFTNDPEIIGGLNLNFNTIVHRIYYGDSKCCAAICVFFPRAYRVETAVSEYERIANDLQKLYLRLEKHGYLYGGAQPYYPLNLGKFVFYDGKILNQASRISGSQLRRMLHSRLPKINNNEGEEYYNDTLQLYDREMTEAGAQLIEEELRTTDRPANVSGGCKEQEVYQYCEYAKEPVYRLFADVGKYQWASRLHSPEHGSDIDDYDVVKEQSAGDLLRGMSLIKHPQFVSLLKHCFDYTCPGYGKRKTAKIEALLNPDVIGSCHLMRKNPLDPEYDKTPKLRRTGGHELNQDFVQNLIATLMFFRLPRTDCDVFLIMCFVAVYESLRVIPITIDEVYWMIKEFDRNRLVSQDLVTRLKLLLPMLYTDDSDHISADEYLNRWREFRVIFQEHMGKYTTKIFELYFRLPGEEIPDLLQP